MHNEKAVSYCDGHNRQDGGSRKANMYYQNINLIVPQDDRERGKELVHVR
jgi:hypothetical protein